MNKVIAIIGPTAIGKSDLAVFIAKNVNGEVISADSRQVYRGLDIGSGKITIEEMQGIPHHLLDVADPMDTYSVVDWKRDAKMKIDEILSRKKTPIICGGTGFWIDALCRGIDFPEVPPNETLRESLKMESAVELFSMLEKLDPERAANIDRRNPVRLIRAIEIASTLGSVPKNDATPPDFKTRFIGLKAPKDTLDARISLRLDKRMNGIIEETRRLIESGMTSERLEALGLEYRHASLYLRGEHASIDAMREKLYFDIVHYAKRQMTWWKRYEDISWIDLDTTNGTHSQKALDIANEFLKK